MQYMEDRNVVGGNADLGYLSSCKVSLITLIIPPDKDIDLVDKRLTNDARYQF